MNAPELSGVDVIVAVGTDHHPFDRLVRWVDAWAATTGNAERTLIQYGTAAAPQHARSVQYLRRDDLLTCFRDARAVVCHGGPSTIVESLRHDRWPLVLPRSPVRGEHVDEHQEQFAAVMAAKGMIRLVPDEATLAAWLDAELAAEAPTRVQVTLPPAHEAARVLGDRVGELLADGPTRRLRLLRSLRRGR